MNDRDELSKKPTITSRLFSLIINMTKDEQSSLLKELEDRISTKGKRRHTRKPFFMVVDYSSKDRTYKDFIQNISPGGVFIETRMPFSIGQEVSLTFPLPSYDKHIKITGQVVRTDEAGIGVKFNMVDEEQETFIKSLLEMI